jgi:hypothetical protein
VEVNRKIFFGRRIHAAVHADIVSRRRRRLFPLWPRIHISKSHTQIAWEEEEEEEEEDDLYRAQKNTIKTLFTTDYF